MGATNSKYPKHCTGQTIDVLGLNLGLETLIDYKHKAKQKKVLET